MKLNHSIFKAVLLASVTLLPLCSGFAASARQEEPVCFNNMGSPIPEFCEVKPNELWRGPKPNKTEMAWLIEKGVKTIINLERLHTDTDAIHRAHVTPTEEYNIDYFRVKIWEPFYAFARKKAAKCDYARTP